MDIITNKLFKDQTDNCQGRIDFDDCRKPLECNISQTTFSGDNTSEHPKPTHEKEKAFHCDKCQRSFNKIEHLKCHIRKMHKDQEVILHDSDKYTQCYVCQKAFFCKLDYRKHFRTHVEENNEKNQKTFLQLSHPHSHMEEKPFVCEICDRSFSGISGLKDHCNTHTGDKPFVCEICQKAFSQLPCLKNHKRIHISKRVKPFRCDLCQKAFYTRYNLERHHRTHTGEKPFVCEICQKAFVCKPGLKNHLLTHTNEKPFVCDVCQKAFSQSSSLQSHLRIHTDVKPFVCEICQKAFYNKPGLKSHLRVHTGEKPFACETCQKAYSHRQHLTQHQCNPKTRKIRTYQKISAESE